MHAAALPSIHPNLLPPQCSVSNVRRRRRVQSPGYDRCSLRVRTPRAGTKFGRLHEEQGHEKDVTETRRARNTPGVAWPRGRGRGARSDAVGTGDQSQSGHLAGLSRETILAGIAPMAWGKKKRREMEGKQSSRREESLMVSQSHSSRIRPTHGSVWPSPGSANQMDLLKAKWWDAVLVESFGPTEISFHPG